MRPTTLIAPKPNWILSAGRLAGGITIGTVAAIIIVPWVITGALYRFGIDQIESNRARKFSQNR